MDEKLSKADKQVVQDEIDASARHVKICEQQVLDAMERAKREAAAATSEAEVKETFWQTFKNNMKKYFEV